MNASNVGDTVFMTAAAVLVACAVPVGALVIGLSVAGVRSWSLNQRINGGEPGGTTDPLRRSSIEWGRQEERRTMRRLAVLTGGKRIQRADLKITYHLL